MVSRPCTTKALFHLPVVPLEADSSLAEQTGTKMGSKPGPKNTLGVKKKKKVKSLNSGIILSVKSQDFKF